MWMERSVEQKISSTFADAVHDAESSIPQLRLMPNSGVLASRVWVSVASLATVAFSVDFILRLAEPGLGIMLYI